MKLEKYAPFSRPKRQLSHVPNWTALNELNFNCKTTKRIGNATRIHDCICISQPVNHLKDSWLYFSSLQSRVQPLCMVIYFLLHNFTKFTFIQLNPLTNIESNNPLFYFSPVKMAAAEKTCDICKFSDTDELNYGPWKTSEDITVHYFCAVSVPMLCFLHILTIAYC